MPKDKKYKLEVVQTAEKIGISHAAQMYKISRVSITKWLKLYHECGEKAFEKNIPKKMTHPLKMSKIDEQKIIELKQNNPKITAAKIIEELKLNYSIRTVLKKISEIPKSNKKIDTDLFHFNIYIQRSNLQDHLPQYYIYIKEHEKLFTFIALAFERNDLTIAIAADYFMSVFSKLEINSANITINAYFKDLSSVLKKKSLFKYVVTEKYGSNLVFKDVGSKLKYSQKLFNLQEDNNHKSFYDLYGENSSNLKFLNKDFKDCQNKNELMKLIQRVNLIENFSKMKHTNFQNKSIFFIQPIIADSFITSFIRQKENYELWKEVLLSAERDVLIFIKMKLLLIQNLKNDAYYEKAIAISTDLLPLVNKKTDLKIKLLYQIGDCYEKISDNNKAETYLKQVFEIKSTNNLEYWTRSIVLFSDIQFKLGKFEQSKHFLAQAEKQIDEKLNLDLMTIIKIRQARIVNKIESIDKAKVILNKYLKIATKKGFTESSYEIAKIFVFTYAFNGNLQKAL